ncbi:MAG: hypothetical protein HY592_00445 [Candidatus Omnitrophica bacterium]|nr:hypothetical protein [Candidatus Omnitrophota bacterium]
MTILMAMAVYGLMAAPMHALPEITERDTDRDGQVDTWVYRYFTGVAWKIAEDRDRDGKADYWRFFKNGVVYKWEQDANADGQVDIRTFFDADHLDNGKPRFVRQWIDGRGMMTRAWDRTPHSLAEARLL